MASTGKSARDKGNNFERIFVNLLKHFGWEACTSRNESKAMDDKGVDIITDMNFHYQLKAVERLSVSYWDILKSMPSDKTRVVVHKKNNRGSIVVMSLEDFTELHINRGFTEKDMYP